jgi:hypothetical protein
MADYLKVSVSAVQTELAGVELLDANQQLAANGLGVGDGIKTSLMTRAIVAAGAYLKEVGTVQSPPDAEAVAKYINTSYIQNALK